MIHKLGRFLLATLSIKSFEFEDWLAQRKKQRENR